MTGVAKNTVVKLPAEAGSTCAGYQDEHLRGREAARSRKRYRTYFFERQTTNTAISDAPSAASVSANHR